MNRALLNIDNQLGSFNSKRVEKHAAVNFRLFPNTFIKTRRIPPFSHLSDHPYILYEQVTSTIVKARLTSERYPISITVSTGSSRLAMGELWSSLGGEYTLPIPESPVIAVRARCPIQQPSTASSTSCIKSTLWNAWLKA